MKNKAWIFVNSFSFNFLEFLVKIYWADFFPWAEKAKKRAVHGKLDRTGPRNKVGQPAQSDRPRGAAFHHGFPRCSFSTSFFGQKILREVLIRKLRFLGFSFSDYLFG
jgi:hypothetical protein